jgi:hypothetical protein
VARTSTLSTPFAKPQGVPPCEGLATPGASDDECPSLVGSFMRLLACVASLASVQWLVRITNATEGLTKPMSRIPLGSIGKTRIFRVLGIFIQDGTMVAV